MPYTFESAGLTSETAQVVGESAWGHPGVAVIIKLPQNLTSRLLQSSSVLVKEQILPARFEMLFKQFLLPFLLATPMSKHREFSGLLSARVKPAACWVWKSDIHLCSAWFVAWSTLTFVVTVYKSENSGENRRRRFHEAK